MLMLRVGSGGTTASGFAYQYSNFQIEYSRNLLFEIGGRREEVFQAVRDRGDPDYQSRQAAYDLKKLRGKDMVRRVGTTRHYAPTSSGLRALAALLVLRDKVTKPLLAASMETRPTHGAQNPNTRDNHYQAISVAIQGVFRELGLAA
jgi:hypothetical protein